MEHLLQSRHDIPHEVTNEEISLENYTNILNNIQEDAVKIPKDKLPKDNNDFNGVGDDSVAISTINIPSDVYTCNFEDLQSS